MTGAARYFGVLAGEGKWCQVVVEVGRFPPGSKTVATGAIGLPGLFKLVAVDVFVASGTRLGQASKPAVGFFGVLLVAGGTGGIQVLALQGEGRLVVVKLVVTQPGCCHVAIFAGLEGVIFGIDLPFVYVFVAVYAAVADVLEAPFIAGQMTSKAGGCQMTSVQRERCFGVVFEGKQAGRKACFGVAFYAIRRSACGGKIALVIILVAGRTGIVWQGVGHPIRHVTLAAVYGLVFACEGEAGPVVVEFIGIHSPPKPFLGVAIGAGRTQLAGVYIRVAGGTVVGRNKCLVLKNAARRQVSLVATEAIHPPVAALEGEPRLVVVEATQPCGGRKRLFGMALVATGAQLAVVGVIVATVAIGKSDV